MINTNLITACAWNQKISGREIQKEISRTLRELGFFVYDVSDLSDKMGIVISGYDLEDSLTQDTIQQFRRREEGVIHLVVRESEENPDPLGDGGVSLNDLMVAVFWTSLESSPQEIVDMISKAIQQFGFNTYPAPFTTEGLAGMIISPGELDEFYLENIAISYIQKLEKESKEQGVI